MKNRFKAFLIFAVCISFVFPLNFIYVKADTAPTITDLKFSDNGTPKDPTDDYVTFTAPAGYRYLDSTNYSYTIQDPTSTTSDHGYLGSATIHSSNSIINSSTGLVKVNAKETFYKFLTGFKRNMQIVLYVPSYGVDASGHSYNGVKSLCTSNSVVHNYTPVALETPKIQVCNPAHLEHYDSFGATYYEVQVCNASGTVLKTIRQAPNATCQVEGLGSYVKYGETETINVIAHNETLGTKSATASRTMVVNTRIANITNVSVTGAALNVIIGRAPVYSGTATIKGDNVNDAVKNAVKVIEFWYELDDNGTPVKINSKENIPLASTAMLPTQKFTTFEAGKKYSYGIAVYAKDPDGYSIIIPLNSQKERPYSINGMDAFVSSNRSAADPTQYSLVQMKTIGGDTHFFEMKAAPMSALQSFLKTLYATTLDREPDTEGLNYWVNQIMAGKRTGAQVVNYFVFGKEFTAKNYCNEHFLTHLYKAIFSRNPDAAGLKYWEDKMAAGTTREAVLNGFMSGKEFKALCTNAGISVGTMPALPAHGTIQTWTCPEDNKMDNGIGNFVLRMYTKCLGRDAEKAGASYWISQLNANKIGGTAVAEQFFMGKEFTNKKLSDSDYLDRLYVTIFDRSSDTSGKSYWLAKMKNGSTRKEVLYGFASGTEWAAICKKYNIIK